MKTKYPRSPRRRLPPKRPLLPLKRRYRKLEVPWTMVVSSLSVRKSTRVKTVKIDPEVVVEAEAEEVAVEVAM